MLLSYRALSNVFEPPLSHRTNLHRQQLSRSYHVPGLVRNALRGLSPAVSRHGSPRQWSLWSGQCGLPVRTQWGHEEQEGTSPDLSSSVVLERNVPSQRLTFLIWQLGITTESGIRCEEGVLVRACQALSEVSLSTCSVCGGHYYLSLEGDLILDSTISELLICGII